MKKRIVFSLVCLFVFSCSMPVQDGFFSTEAGNTNRLNGTENEGTWTDFDGNGIPDYICLSSNGRSYIVTLRDAAGNETQMEILKNADLGYSSSRLWFDYNGDGKSDYVCLIKTEPREVYSIYLSTGNGIGERIDIAREKEDFDGNGVKDLIFKSIGWNSFIIALMDADGTVMERLEVLKNATPILMNEGFWTNYNNDGKIDFKCFLPDYAYPSEFVLVSNGRDLVDPAQL